MKKAFVSLYVGFAARYLISFVSLPFLARELGPSGLGTLAIATSVAIAVSTFVEYGFSISALREVSSAEIHERSGILIGVTAIKLALLGVVGLAYGVLNLSFPALSQFPANLGLVVVLGGAQGFNLSWYFLGTSRATVSAAIEIATHLTWFIPVFFLVRSASDVNLVLTCQLASYVALVAIAHVIALTNLTRISVNWRKVIEQVKSGAPLFIMKASMAAQSAAIVSILGAMAGPEQAGYFNAADRFAGTIIALFSPASQAIMPYLFNRTAKDGHDAMFHVSRNILIVMVLIAFIFTIGACLSAQLLIITITGSQYTPSILVLQILSVTFPLVAINQALGFYVLLPLRLDHTFVAGSILADCVCLGLTYFFAPSYGAAGVAFSRVVSVATTMIIFSIALYHKRYIKKLLFQGPISQADPAFRQ